MRLTYTGRGRLLEGDKTIEHGGQFTVSDKRAETLLADPTVSVEPAHSELADLTRAELNALAAKAGITSPERLPNRAVVIEALTQHEPTEGSTPTEDQEVSE